MARGRAAAQQGDAAQRAHDAGAVHGHREGRGLERARRRGSGRPRAFTPAAHVQGAVCASPRVACACCALLLRVMRKI